MPIQFKKKRNEEAFERAHRVIASLDQLAQRGECDLMVFDESGFSPNPPVHYGWTRIGQSRCVEPHSHRQRVNVLGALHHSGELTWASVQRPTVRDDVMAFFEQMATQPHSVPRIVILDNAAIHNSLVRRHDQSLFFDIDSITALEAVALGMRADCRRHWPFRAFMVWHFI